LHVPAWIDPTQDVLYIPRIERHGYQVQGGLALGKLYSEEMRRSIAHLALDTYLFYEVDSFLDLFPALEDLTLVDHEDPRPDEAHDNWRQTTGIQFIEYGGSKVCKKRKVLQSALPSLHIFRERATMPIN
jgi:hypothetical protein